jgi:hypothetical protein
MIGTNAKNKAVQILSIENGKFILDEQKLLEILTQPHTQNKPVDS